jgi:short-subunit dehydrogenase
MPRGIQGSSVVITGASSGIGYGTALAFARRGASLMLAARNREGLFRVADAGLLINLSSVWGRITTPLVTPYVVSKHAIRAFSECLRHELEGAPDIHVITILPQAVDTPIFEHAGNYSGRRMRPIPPILSPAEIADGIVACAEAPKREVTFGRSGRLLEIIASLSPRLYCRFAPAMFVRGTSTGESALVSAGNVLTPAAGQPSGGWRAHRRHELRHALAGAIAGLGLALIGRRGHPQA